MALKGNKGEWSEVYTHFKLLADGKIYSGNADLTKLNDIFFPIIQIMRLEGGNREYIYKLSSDGKHIDIASDEEAVVLSVTRDNFSEMAQTLLEHIKHSGDTTFSIDEIESFMAVVKMFKLKVEGKSDIRMIIHNIRTEQSSSLGYSIKSRLGADSTLVNTNKDGTNFLFSVTGNLSDAQISSINTLDTINARINKIVEYGCKLSYVDVVNPILKNNLIYLDSDLHTIIAYCLLGYYSHQSYSSTVKDVIKFVSFCNPCNYNADCGMDFYEHKMKQFLITYALGMTSNTKWDGQYQANGGYIVVKEDGDIVCYHFYDRNQLEDYLFANTYFETPSTSRHKHGSVEKDETTGKLFIKLNIQIRFIGNEKRKWHNDNYRPDTVFIK